MTRLTGSQNPLVKEIRALKSKSGREEKGRYFIEGARFVAEALKENINIKYVMISDAFMSERASAELLSMINSKGFECYQLPDGLFESISDTKTPQGILAVLGMERRRLEAGAPDSGLLVLLDAIKDPGNMGTIIRTADAAGCAGIIVTEGCVDVFNPKVLRSTMGSIFHIPVFHCANMGLAVDILKKKEYRIYASYLEGSTSIYAADMTGPVALVIGSEAEGIGEETIKAADQLIRIPMGGRAESLNASVAAGIMIFEAMRQRKE